MGHSKIIQEQEHPLTTSLVNQPPITNPFVGQLRRAVELSKTGPAQSASLIRQALDYATDTEQYVSELTARIRLLESLTVTDELTGLYNRRGFDQILLRNLANAARHKETGVLAVIDLDDFKQINDEFGHGAGDEMLRTVGRFLRQKVRTTDYACRLGGDEFTILFVRADHAQARERARTLNRELNTLTVELKSKKIRVKASLGLASYDGGTDPAELMERADRAMYNEKRRPKPEVVKS